MQTSDTYLISCISLIILVTSLFKAHVEAMTLTLRNLSIGLLKTSLIFENIMNIRFDNKNVLVLGGSKGIGKGIANKFCELGAAVVNTGRSSDPFQIDQINQEYWYFQGDLADEQTQHRLVEFVNKKFATVDCVICNVGGVRPQDDFETEADSWSWYISQNFETSRLHLNCLSKV